MSRPIPCAEPASGRDGEAGADLANDEIEKIKRDELQVYVSGFVRYRSDDAEYRTDSWAVITRQRPEGL